MELIIQDFLHHLRLPIFLSKIVVGFGEEEERNRLFQHLLLDSILLSYTMLIELSDIIKAGLFHLLGTEQTIPRGKEKYPSCVCTCREA